ncbi:hypothetical protein EVAR_75419_1 [Eumeta japonica]|uniref:Uncharacterized protein n=1 Tax=Eumeta variegata TaxID=151549 RepID=A0A4C1TMW0_EUMVA|nr:hypothetical protein EVAR_75419_1 [Eumeta japonica]
MLYCFSAIINRDASPTQVSRRSTDLIDGPAAGALASLQTDRGTSPSPLMLGDVRATRLSLSLSLSSVR